MLILDTTVLVYAVGADHPLRDPCRRVIEAIRDGAVAASTTVEVVQELVHVRARRTSRAEAAKLGRDYARLLAPLFTVTPDDLDRGLRLYERDVGLGSFDAVLAAVAMEREPEAFISADRAFADVRGLRYVDPGGPHLAELLP